MFYTFFLIALVCHSTQLFVYGTMSNKKTVSGKDKSKSVLRFNVKKSIQHNVFITALYTNNDICKYNIGMFTY